MTDEPTPNDRETLIKLIDNHDLSWEVDEWWYESGKYDQPTLTIDVTWAPDNTGNIDAEVVPTAGAPQARGGVNTVKEVIAQIEADHERGAPITDVSRVAVCTFGMSADTFHDEIEKLRTKGEVYEPTQGCLRTT